MALITVSDDDGILEGNLMTILGGGEWMELGEILHCFLIGEPVPPVKAALSRLVELGRVEKIARTKHPSLYRKADPQSTDIAVAWRNAELEVYADVVPFDSVPHREPVYSAEGLYNILTREFKPIREWGKEKLNGGT